MSDLTDAQALALVNDTYRPDVALATMMLSGKRPDGTAIDTPPMQGTLVAPDAFAVSGGGIVIPVTVTIDVAAYSIGDSFGYAGATTSDGWKIADAMRVDGGDVLSNNTSA